MSDDHSKSEPEYDFRVLDETTAKSLLADRKRVFFRNDDVSGRDLALDLFVEVFGRCRIPVTLGVIPRYLTARSAGDLEKLKDAHGSSVELHQHGYSHQNHGFDSEKYEFGANRPQKKQFKDLANGWRTLEELLPNKVFKAFSAPWNRVTRNQSVDFGLKLSMPYIAS